jgi:RHS repeat-associated protein
MIIMRLEARWQGGSTIKARTATASTCPLVQQVGGKEEDKEWGSQMIQDYGFRIYNPTIGKFLSVDPLTKEYPELTTYQFASNTPIQAIDLDGLEAFFIHGTMSSSTKRWFNQYENDEGKLQLRQHDVTKTLFLLT